MPIRSRLRSSHLLTSLFVAVATSTSPALAGAAKTVLLRGEVIDAETRAPLPCRISIQGENGDWHFPSSVALEGSAVVYNKRGFTDPNIVEMHTTLSAHPFQVALEPGRYTLVIEHGKEYHPETRRITIANEPLRVTIALRRWIDMARLGWYSGETHTHRELGDLPNLMLAEDLNVTFPLVDWVREAFVAPTARRKPSFRDPGPDPIKIDATHWIYPRNTEYELFTVGGKPHTLGAFFVINHKTPLDLGAPPVRPVAERAHREGALIELDKHNWPWSMALVPIMPVDLFELSNNHVWRTDFGIPAFGEPAAGYMKVERDARGFTERGWIDFGFQNYYALLDCGFRLRPTAGTASGVHPVPLGFGRVYVHLGQGKAFDGSAWLEALNLGRSFVTTGPMLLATLDGQDPGTVPHRGGSRLQGRAVSAIPLKTIEIVINGQVARALAPENRKTGQGAYESLIDETLPIDGPSWVAVRCFEDRPDGRVRFAHTGPFHIEVPGKPLHPRKEEVDYLIRRVEEQIARSAPVLPPVAVEEYRQSLAIYRSLAATAR
jgi:hypothetical protein